MASPTGTAGALRAETRWLRFLPAALLAALGLALAAHGSSTKTFALLALAVVIGPLLLRPRAFLALTVLLTILCEGPTFGLFTFTSHLYDEAFKGLTPLDGLVALTVVAVGIDIVRHRRAIVLPRVLAFPAALLALAMLAGIVTGHANGASTRSVVLGEDTLAYLLFLPLAIVNLPLSRRQIEVALWVALAVAMLKAVLGLVEIAGGYGEIIEGTSQLTYYEPAPNWLIMMSLLALLAACLRRTWPARWMLLGSPLLLACFVLSYRRSFWIAAALGVALLVLLGLSPAGRRLLVPAALLLALAIWLLSVLGFQLANSPVIERATSLAPTKLESNLQDSYRLYERANVLGEIKQHPITGLGMEIPWAATVRPLPIYNPGGQLYVHFAALWWWLKLGILGLAAYVATIASALLVSWRAWRRSREPTLKAFSLASLCAFTGLLAIETTASFTGVDARFSVLIATQIGLLATIARSATSRSGPAAGAP